MNDSRLAEVLDQVSGRIGELFPGQSELRALLVSGPKTLSALGGLTPWKTISLLNSIIGWTYSSQLVSDKEATLLVSKVRRFKPDVLIGFGGGIAMDLAKIASANSSPKCISIQDQDASSWSEIRDLDLPIIFVPTLFGSGAESTFHSVIYRGQSKYSMKFRTSTKVRRILVANLSDSAATGSRLFAALDAVCQGIETTWSNSATKESRAIALEGLGSVFVGFDDYVEAIDSTARNNFVHGASLIGEAMNTGQTTAPHALSYFLTSRLGIPHGYAVAVILRYFWSFMNGPDVRAKLPKPLLEKLTQINGLVNTSMRSDLGLENWMTEVFSKYSLQDNLGTLLISNKVSELDFLNGADPSRLSNHPLELGLDTIKNILQI